MPASAFSSAPLSLRRVRQLAQLARPLCLPPPTLPPLQAPCAPAFSAAACLRFSGLFCLVCAVYPARTQLIKGPKRHQLRMQRAGRVQRTAAAGSRLGLGPVLSAAPCHKGGFTHSKDTTA